ncbi:SAYSvFN domain-containing protein 1 isoform X2 [Pleurodeles waltl]|uniref:SAYSvFN domain-containing protein 1 isoform X2 n=1 Tax=Pleurodeles waltl TaxID=8319 RepID=UPI003709924D
MKPPGDTFAVFIHFKLSTLHHHTLTFYEELPSPPWWGQQIAPVLPTSSFEDGSYPQQSKPVSSLLTKTLLLKFLLWLVLLGLFVELEFGLVYFVLSMFYWIYEGMRGPGEKKPGEKSAYSVFNPGCESIQGTLTAEQLERELQYRPLLGF